MQRRVALLQRRKGVFTHHTSDCFKAVWSSDSTRCVLLDAPDNANSYLWLFRLQGRDIATERLDYDKISNMIEAAVPATRPRETPGFITRSGIDAITWLSPSELKLAITYNNIPVIVMCDVAKPHSPKFMCRRREGPNQPMELTATRRMFTFQMANTLSLRATLALGSGSSSCSR
jgi:hypothetical protein